MVYRNVRFVPKLQGKFCDGSDERISLTHRALDFLRRALDFLRRAFSLWQETLAIGVADEFCNVFRRRLFQELAAVEVNGVG